MQEVRETDLEYTTLKINITFEEALDISSNLRIQTKKTGENWICTGHLGSAHPHQNILWKLEVKCSLMFLAVANRGLEQEMCPPQKFPC